MTIAAGVRLGPYEILSPLGAGGMGEVYRARDARLSRDVAIKVLPEAFAADAERLTRFRREAQVLASLNHPHIAAIYGLEESGGVEALVLELVAGETLAERLVSGPLPPEEALEIARQIAEALEAAHEKGIVHRDLKPSNVKRTPEGQVKVLDFGLAKALSIDGPSSDASTSPTLTASATRAGVVVGTAAYMSPEQARGKPVDRRSDIWAFGAVLYEMLTGSRAFSGETVSDTLAAVLKTEPDWSALPAEIPASVRRLLARCLRKDSTRRLRDIGDARLELEDAAGASLEPSSPGPRAAGSHRRPLVIASLLGLAVGAAAAALILYRVARASSPSDMHFTAVTNFSGLEAQPSLSPDGRSVAFVSNREGQYDIWVGLVTGGRLVRITNDPNLEATPRWSPDGATIAYSRLNDSGLFDIWQIPALGGTPRRIVTDAMEPGWSADGRSIVYRNLSTSTIWICDATGSNARAVTQPDAASSAHRSPALSHGGREVAFLQWASGPYGELAVADLQTGRIRTLTHDGALVCSPAWSPDDRFLYFASSRGGAVNVWKIPSAGGNPEQITAGQGDDGDLALSADGSRMVFSTYRQNINIALMDLAAGASEPKPIWLTSDAARGELAPAFSPDGKRIAYFTNRKGAEREGIWVMNADGSNPVPLVVDDYRNTFPRWCRDGQALIFRSRSSGAGKLGEWIRRVAITGGPPRVVTTLAPSSPPTTMPLWAGFQPDVDSRGRILLRNARRRAEIYDSDTKQTQVLEGCVGEAFRWSPDDRRIAYLASPGGADAGLWIYDFRNPPRQIFQGWVVEFAWAGPDELIYAEGRPDLRALLWRVGSDGSGRRSIPVTMPTAAMYWELLPGSGRINVFDVSAGGRRLAFRALEQSEADIGMIEGVR